jgi:hypothetical protein
MKLGYNETRDLKKYYDFSTIPQTGKDLISTEGISKIIGYSTNDNYEFKTEVTNTIQIKKTQLGRGMGEKKLQSIIENNLSRNSILTKTKHTNSVDVNLFQIEDSDWYLTYILHWGSSKYHMNFEFHLIQISSKAAAELGFEEFISQEAKDLFLF